MWGGGGDRCERDFGAHVYERWRWEVVVSGMVDVDGGQGGVGGRRTLMGCGEWMRVRSRGGGGVNVR